jgi:hypothetical protein
MSYCFTGLITSLFYFYRCRRCLVCVICWTYYVLRHWVFFLSFFEIFSRLLRQYTTIKREQQSTTKTNNNNNTHTTIKRMGIFLYFGTCGVLRMWWLLYCFLYDFQLLLRQYTTIDNKKQQQSSTSHATIKQVQQSKT